MPSWVETLLGGAAGAIGASLGASAASPKAAVAPCKCGALIVYGRGADLGDFKVFADYLAAELKPKFGANIIVKNIENKNVLMDYLETFSGGFGIEEFHIFSHSIGAGLYLGYYGQEGRDSRGAAIAKAVAEGRSITFQEVRDAEVGGLLTDDLVKAAFVAKRATIRGKFCVCGPVGTPFIKLWGCNAGVEGWTYSDDGGFRYWDALNDENTPKPSIAKAFAKYFDMQVWAASSGSHIEVKTKSGWITSQQYFDANKKWPSGALQHRLAPDKGSYGVYEP